MSILAFDDDVDLRTDPPELDHEPPTALREVEPPPSPRPHCSTPHSLDELDIPVSMVEDLVLRTLLNASKMSTFKMSERLALSPMLMTELIEQLRDERLVEILGLEGRDYLVALTDEGRRQAAERMALCRYVGPAPVSLASYTAVIREQHAEPELDLDVLREAFADLVIADDLLRELGPASMSDGAMFLYGPPGTGKSAIAERLHRVHDDSVLVPYAVEVDGQIVVIFDPVVHRAVGDPPAGTDARWAACRRPWITVGGELTADMIDLAYQDKAGVYLAPLQMQANNGILVIDDFGRQSLTPEQLLNRWIVPLDRSLDYLTLDYGFKFEVPFDAKIVFSTNLQPESLGDEAFYRRIESKVLVPPIADEQFDEVLRRITEAKGIEVEPGAAEHLRTLSRELGDGDLRPYLPGVVCRVLTSIARFDGRPLRLDRDVIERIARTYFTRASGKVEPGEVVFDDVDPVRA